MSLSCYWQWISSSHCQSSLRIHLAIASWIQSCFNNVMTKFMINNRTDAWKTDVNLLNWITQMTWHIPTVHLFSFKILTSPWPKRHVKFELKHLMISTMRCGTGSQNLPKTIPVEAVKRVLVVDEIYIQPPIPLSALIMRSYFICFSVFGSIPRWNTRSRFGNSASNLF